MSVDRICIIGRPEAYHLGAQFLAAAQQIGLTAEILDVRRAWSDNQWLNRFFYHFGRRRPTRLRRFDADVESLCQRLKPQWLLVTGISPPGVSALQRIGRLGVRRCNFLSDDPWNSRNGAGFFWKSLPQYDLLCSPRRSNLAELVQHGCRQVSYLPFGYDNKSHFPAPPMTPIECEKFGCDVALVGCADNDRIPLALALVRAGLRVNLYGAYWNRYAKLRAHWKGLVFGQELRMAVGGACVNLGLVRRANRDGHAMRSFEVPAMGGCMLTEDTAEHREIFGEDGKAVVYFNSIPQMLERARWLLAHPDERRRLATAAHELITQGKNTYADRLQTMLGAEGRRGDETTRRRD